MRVEWTSSRRSQARRCPKTQNVPSGIHIGHPRVRQAKPTATLPYACIHPCISSRIRACVLSDIDLLRSPSQQETDQLSPQRDLCSAPPPPGSSSTLPQERMPSASYPTHSHRHSHSLALRPDGHRSSSVPRHSPQKKRYVMTNTPTSNAATTSIGTPC
jgi:hypothetical protein